MKKILTSNRLKIIALITMIIDHIGYYLYPILNKETYYLFRNIGRIAMPLFAYLIVQGFFHTKNIKKYIIRIFSLAIVTQILLGILGYINNKYYTNYVIGINNYLNILFSYGLSLILLFIIDKTVQLKNSNNIQNIVINYSVFVFILMLFFIIPIDYGIRIPFIMLCLYFIEKLCKKNKTVYLFLILFVFLISLIGITNSNINSYCMLISVLFIALYNGEKGKNSKFIQYLFYILFPIHHVILYTLALLLK